MKCLSQFAGGVAWGFSSVAAATAGATLVSLAWFALELVYPAAALWPRSVEGCIGAFGAAAGLGLAQAGLLGLARLNHTLDEYAGWAAVTATAGACGWTLGDVLLKHLHVAGHDWVAGVVLPCTLIAGAQYPLLIGRVKGAIWWPVLNGGFCALLVMAAWVGLPRAPHAVLVLATAVVPAIWGQRAIRRSRDADATEKLVIRSHGVLTVAFGAAALASLLAIVLGFRGRTPRVHCERLELVSVPERWLEYPAERTEISAARMGPYSARVHWAYRGPFAEEVELGAPTACNLLLLDVHTQYAKYGTGVCLRRGDTMLISFADGSQDACTRQPSFAVRQRPDTVAPVSWVALYAATGIALAALTVSAVGLLRLRRAHRRADRPYVPTGLRFRSAALVSWLLLVLAVALMQIHG